MSPPDQWYYLDPQNKERGPFETSQMQAWFVNGFFHADLPVKQPNESTYKSLSELIRTNGALTPFNFKNHSPPRQSPDLSPAQFSEHTRQNARNAQQEAMRKQIEEDKTAKLLEYERQKLRAEMEAQMKKQAEEVEAEKSVLIL
jgi:PERQ amino acid-rich with GYF domain-containing protein